MQPIPSFAGDPVKFIREKDGVTVFPETYLSGNARAVKLQVITDNIIRVMASPGKEIPGRKSLITVYSPPSADFTLTESTDKVTVQTSSLTATVTLATGAVVFTDKNGRPLLAERPHNGRNLQPAVFEGQSVYGITQTFETTDGDAYYGLGQHQDDIFNYHHRQVFLFQNNTEVAVPFLISRKNYGILWDNYSLTKAGDTREYLPLSRLQLFSAKGEPGWLTASYSNQRQHPEKVAFTRAESIIDYPYLDDSKKNLPADFAVKTGVLTWEGSIASDFSGLHTLRFTYGGYLKVWVNGKLMADKWRQAWNPGTALLEIDLEKNKKYPVKIMWTPDGDVSYISARWINPVPEADRNAFTIQSEAGQFLDYYFIHGNNMDEVVSGYRQLTGKAPIVPKWAMGFWQSRERYKTQHELLQAVAEYRKRKLPLDNIVLDWSYWKEDAWGSQEFDPQRFPSPDSMIQALHERYHARFMISVWPKFYEGIPAYREFDKQGWLYRRNIADRQRDWIGKGYVSTFYDAFNERARRGFWELLHKKLYNKGVDAWWMDASEPDVLSNVSPEKRKEQMSPTANGTAAEYLNAYPLENAKGIYNGQRSVDADKRVFLLTRSGFAGSQHYAAAIWSGDIAARWEDMRTQISAGLNFSLSGIPFWTMDIGGFAVEPRYEKPTAADLEEWRELQARWFQFGSMVPLFRSHGQLPFREIYNISPEGHPAYKSMQYYSRLRYRLMPYIYTLAGMAYHRDYTIMRALVMDFPEDENVREIGDQFMFGPSLLVSPVYVYKARERSLYLPSGGGWYDFYSGKYFDGGKRITVAASYETMPVFVKEGSILLSGPALQYTAEKKADTVTVHVYTGKDAEFTLYEDEDTNYNYEKGAFSNITFSYKEAGGTLTIGGRHGEFPGMLRDRVFRVVWISRNEPKGWNPEGKADEVVRYSGVTVKLVKK
ncbi:TIM-barrel domain-containing protein [Chitinophaga sp. GCM10012297]|uniref:DUF5110 domain-containing protein n=1 Tax=Chitinophaga chungangae TaxID=2821488 RepID=A0ABS3YKI9_9BACT|nr:TIM-barrel domain-containing protein [Chitinophaga chungangae]MBO9155202.1 DUF5110 domain-containing protein [Chitinophaga chungangae]